MGLFRKSKPNVEKFAETRDIGGLARALKYKGDADVRRRAALALGEIGDVGATEFLYYALNDEDERVAQAAAYALGRMIVRFPELREVAAKAVADVKKRMGE